MEVGAFYEVTVELKALIEEILLRTAQASVTPPGYGLSKVIVKVASPSVHPKCKRV